MPFWACYDLLTLVNKLIPQEGALYVTAAEKSYQILKVLKFEGAIVHVRLYKNRFDEIPARVDPAILTLGTIHDPDGFGMGHLPLSYNTFLGWKPQFLQPGLVLPDELDGYEMWKQTSDGRSWQ